MSIYKGGIVSAVTKKDLVQAVADETGLTQIDAKVVVEELLDVISETLENDNSIEIRGFGTFYTKIRKPRPARNIKTGETVPLKERVVPLFRYSADLKGKIDRANKGGPIESIFIEV